MNKKIEKIEELLKQAYLSRFTPNAEKAWRSGIMQAIRKEQEVVGQSFKNNNETSLFWRCGIAATFYSGVLGFYLLHEGVRPVDDELVIVSNDEVSDVYSAVYADDK